MVWNSFHACFNQILLWSSVEKDSRFLETWLEIFYTHWAQKQLEKILANFVFLLLVLQVQLWNSNLHWANMIKLPIWNFNFLSWWTYKMPLFSCHNFKWKCTLAIQDFLGGKSGWVTSYIKLDVGYKKSNYLYHISSIL